VGEDERELAHAVGGELGGLEVLDYEDAVADVEHLRDLEGPGGVLGRDGAVAPRVAARERDAVLDEPVGHVVAWPGLAGEVRLGVVPARAPAGVEEDGVAGARIEARDVVECDDPADAQVPRRHVHEPAARDDLRDRLSAELGEAGGSGQLRDGPAVVAPAALLQVAERVQVRPELSRAGDDLRDPVDLVLPHRHLRVPVVGGRDEGLAEVASGEDGGALVEDAAEVVEPAAPDERQRLATLGVVDVVEHPKLVVGPERRRPPAHGGFWAHSDDHGSRKSAKRVRPPSTKIVWPVM
jgi:hypothetical protein